MEKLKTTWENKERSQAELTAIDKMQSVAEALIESLREANKYPQTTIVTKDKFAGTETEKVVDCKMLIDVSENKETGKVYTALVVQAGTDQLKLNYDLESDEVTSFQYKQNAFEKGSKWAWVNNIENPKAELVELTKIIPSKSKDNFTKGGSVAFEIYLKIAKDFRAREDVPTMENKEGKTVQAYGVSNLEDSSFTSNNGNKVSQQTFSLFQKKTPESNIRESVEFNLREDGSLKSVRLMQYDYNNPPSGKKCTFMSETVKATDGNFNKFNKLTEDKNLVAYTQDMLSSYGDAVKSLNVDVKEQKDEPTNEEFTPAMDEEELPFE